MTPKVGLFLPARDGHDVGVAHSAFPDLEIVGLEHSPDVMRLQRCAPNLTDKSKGKVSLYLTTFGKFVSGEIKPQVLPSSGNTFMTVSAELHTALCEVKFDCGYVDYVQSADSDTISDIRSFLKHRTADRYVIAVTNTLLKTNDVFGRYDTVASDLGIEFERNDYQDSEAMGFGMFIKR